MKKELKSQNRDVPHEGAPKGLIGLSRAISDLNNKISKMAEFLAVKKEPILVTGDSGIGKRVLVEAVLNLVEKEHGRKWHLLDCTAIPKELVRSELFGHKKGAFTGADRDKMGILTQAGSNIVFLDEIGDLPDDIKSSLLLAFEGREVMPVGGLQGDQVKADFTLISATNKDPRDLKVLPNDLYRRISTWHEHIPGLSERRIDIIPLICKITTDIGEDIHERKLCWSLRNYFHLLEYGWNDGGYRGLKNEIVYLILNNKVSGNLFEKIKKQNEIKGPWVTIAGGKEHQSPDEVFNAELKEKLERCNICLSPKEMLRLLETEIQYYALNHPKDHKNPAEFLDAKLFFFSLLLPFQRFAPEEYTPYTSYKRVRSATTSDNYSFRFVPCPSRLRQPKGDTAPIGFSSEEITLSDLLAKKSYREVDEIVKRLIFKHKILLGLTWAEIQKKYDVDARAIKAVINRKSQ